MDHEMIERCAKAMVQAMTELSPNDYNAKIVIIAIIKAMREPTEKMIISGCEGNPTQWTENTDDSFAADVAHDVWLYMIDVITND